MLARAGVGALSWAGPAGMAVMHAVLLRGVFTRHPLAIEIAAYLGTWPIAEGIALVVTPWILMIRARDHEDPLWQRILWLPALLLIAGGVAGSIRFLRATWIYIVGHLPRLLYERSTKLQGQIGCARSYGAVFVLALVLGLFGDRPYQWPIGTIVGRGLSRDERELANMMAGGVVYFAIMTVADILIHRAVRRQVGPA